MRYYILSILLLGGTSSLWAGSFVLKHKKKNECVWTNGERSVRLQLCSPDMVRFTKSRSLSFEENEPWMVVNYQWERVSYSLTENESDYRIKTDSLEVCLSKSDASVRIHYNRGHSVWQELSSMHYDGNSVYNNCRLLPDEHFFGFGERMDFFDQRGKKIYLNVERGNGPKPAVGNKDVLRANYCPVPFFMSSAGYGIFFHTAYPTTWDMGESTPDTYSFSAENGELDYYFLYGDFYHLIDCYTSLTGKSPLMPKKAYGLHLGTYSGGTWKHEDQTSDRYPVQLAEKMRSLGIPFDLMWLDSTWRKFKSGGNGASTFEWRETFDDPRKMFQKLEDMHVMGGLHVRSIVDNGDSLHLLDEAREAGVLYPGAKKEGLINFFDCKASDWWLENAVSKLADIGCRFLKTDVGSALTVSSDVQGEEAVKAKSDHNLFPLAYAAAPYDYYMKKSGLRGFNHTREGYAGIQRYPFIWAGDWGSEWQWFAPMIVGGLNIGLSGVGYWSHCMGGFEQYSPRDTELYMRWVQFGMFSPVSILVGMDHPHYHEPWTYGDEALRNFIKYDSLRYALLPYIYSTGYEMYQTGRPMMRPLLLDSPKDYNVYSVTDQYLFGDHIMVCPVTVKGALSRFIYFPEGIWFRFGSNEGFMGKQYKSFLTPVDELPLFVKGGAIIPMQKVVQYIGEQSIGELILQVYPGGNSSFDWYDDDGETMDYQRGVYSLVRFSSEWGASEWKFTITPQCKAYRNKVNSYLIQMYRNTVPVEVSYNGVRLVRADVITEKSGGEGWEYDPATQLMTIRVNRQDKESQIRVR